MTLLVVSLAGSVGAVLRYLVSGWAQRRSGSDFPIGTLVVNVVGSLCLGLVVGSGDLDSTLTIGATGLLGGFTTFSTWMVETIRLGVMSRRGLGNLTLSVVAGVTVAILGYTLSN